MILPKIVAIILLLHLLTSEATDQLIKPSTTRHRPSTPKPKTIVDDFKNSKNRQGIEELAPYFLGHGGPYGALRDTVSKQFTIESDHAPHYSILDYVDKAGVKHLKGRIKDDVETRLTLQEDLDKKSFRQNEDRLRELDKQMKQSQTSDRAKLELEYNNLVEANKKLSKPLRDHNNKIKNKMGVLSIPYEDHRMFPSTGMNGLSAEIMGLQSKGLDEAEKLKNSYQANFVENVKKGLDPKTGYLQNPDKFNRKSLTLENCEKIWEQNFGEILSSARAYDPKKVSSKRTSTDLRQEYMDQLHKSYCKKFMTAAIVHMKTPKDGLGPLMSLYIKEYKIYLGDNFDKYKLGLVKLLETNRNLGWLTEGEVSNLRETHELRDVDLTTSPPDSANKWNEVEEVVRIKSDKFEQVAPSNDKGKSAGSVVCQTSSRRKRSTDGSSCIFYCKTCNQNQGEDLDNNNDDKDKVIRDDVDNDKPPRVNNGDDDEVRGKPIPGDSDDVDKPGKPSDDSVDNPKVKQEADNIIKPKIDLPPDGDIVSIDSNRLKAYLSQTGGNTDIDSVRNKDAIVEHASRNLDKLSGSEEDISKAKALLQLENLESHVQKNELAINTIRNNDDTATTSKSLTKYEKVKVSTTKIAKKTEGFTTTSGKVSGGYGKIMLAKGVVSALRHGDTEGLALIGGRIGLEAALKGVTEFGEHLTKASSKMAKTLGKKVLAKMAGPVGFLADVGLNIYSITKSVKILNDPNASKWDKNDAIIDIVADSIDIAVTVATTVLSLIFPPLAPLFALIAFIINFFISLFSIFWRAKNHVKRLNEQMPLLDFEKEREYARYISWQDTSPYIQDLIDMKNANNIMVNMTTQFLNKNQHFNGKVFPSRTMQRPAGNDKCLLKCSSPFIFCKGDILSECDGKGKLCSGDYSDAKCETKHLGIFRYHHYCDCDQPPPWGYEIPDNEVDFSSKQKLYLHRAVPDMKLPLFIPQTYQYICKPSSKNFLGYQVSQHAISNWYLCNGAIGVRRPSKGATHMWYDLGKGNDRIILNDTDTEDNLFTVGDGRKEFSGNGGDDIFMIQGPCQKLSGTLDGKGYRKDGNSVVLGEKCTTAGTTIFIDMLLGVMKSNQTCFLGICWNMNMTMDLHNIHRVFGREKETEWITANCETKLIAGGGGRSPQQPDVVEVPLCESKFELTVAVKGHTHLNASKFSSGTVNTILQGKFEFQAKLPTKFDGRLIFISQNDNELIDFEVDSSTTKLGSGITLKFSNGGRYTFEVVENENSTSNLPELNKSCETGKEEKGQAILFLNETSRFSRQIMCNLNPERFQCVFSLEKGVNETDSSDAVSLRGYNFTENMFLLKSGNWSAFGGRFNDQFLLNDGNFSGTINGLGGVNSLILTESMDASQITVNLQEKTLHLDDNSSSPVIGLSSIQIVGGRKGKQEKVILACDTKLVMLEGGESAEAPDQLEITERRCYSERTLVLGEFTTVSNNATTGDFKYHIRTSKNFDIKYNPTTSTNHSFIFEISFNHIQYISLNLDQDLEISFDNETKKFPLNFQNIPKFQIGQGENLVAELIIEEGEPLKSSIVFRDSCSEHELHGLNGVENEISVETRGSVQSILGGDKDDNIFLLDVHSISLIDGNGGVDRLQFSEELHKEKGLQVDFQEGTINFMKDNDQKVPFVLEMKGIEMFTGREHSFDSVLLGCDTASVKFAEEIRVEKDCSYEVRLEIGQGTRVIFDIKEEPEKGQEERETLSTEETEDFAEDYFTETPSHLDTTEHTDQVYFEEGIHQEKAVNMLNSSTFYYYFSIIRSFDIEVDSFSQLRLTRHIFYLNFTISELSSLRFSVEESRLIYSINGESQMEYSHLVGAVSDFSMFYNQPEFMTAEGFLLRISRYGEIIAVIANNEEILELERVQQFIVPRLSAYASKLNISFMLETSSDFIYCGAPNELDVLTNRATGRSHLVGYNETTYEILDLTHSTYIYPQFVEVDSFHMVDLTTVISQIRNKTNHKYIPNVNQVGDDLEIEMKNWTDSFPGKVVLINGTFYYRNIAILLNSIAMEIVAGEDLIENNNSEIRNKRGIDENGKGIVWSIKPRPISIPEGHVYLLAGEDLEDGVEVREERTENKMDYSTFEYSQNETDLLITSNSSSFIIFDYFSPGGDGHDSINASGKVETVNNIQVKLGKKVVHISSNEPLVSGNGDEILVQAYEDILDREEARILKGFPDIPRKYQVPWAKKLLRSPAFRYGILAAIIVFLLFVAGLLFMIYRKWKESGKFSVRKSQKDILVEEKERIPLKSVNKDTLDENLNQEDN